MRNKLLLLLFSILFTTSVFAQNSDQVDKYRKDSENLISFLQYLLNALGNNELSVSDKEVIVSESYLKAFYDSKVQIEDDLIANREVTINKDVQAYLKDVDFFFKSVNFELRIEDITQGVNEKNELFFTVKVNRHMQGIGLEGDSVNNSLVRFVELNVDPKEKALKIASIYTTKLGEKEELTRWWISLSPSWKSILGKDIIVGDTYKLNDVSVLDDTNFLVGGKKIDPSVYNVYNAIRQATEITDLDLSGKKEIIGIEPLYELTKLKNLNISNTGVTSLVPIRNLTTIETLDCSNTLINDINPLRYSSSLLNLNISGTKVLQIDVVTGFHKIQQLNVSNLQIDTLKVVSECTTLTALELQGNKKITDLAFLSPLVQLHKLNIGGTSISQLTGIEKLVKLEDVNTSNTTIDNLNPIGSLTGLKSLNIESTNVTDLMPVARTSVTTIYCDNSGVDKAAVVEFLIVKPDTKIIFQTEKLKSWWKDLDDVWKQLVFNRIKSEEEPSSEILHQIIRVDSININGHNEITDVKPLSEVLFLRKLNISSTSISDLSPISGQDYLEVINFSNTNVSDVSVLKGKNYLIRIDGNSSKVENIDSLAGLERLQYINLDSTQVKNVNAINELPAFKIGYFDHTNVTDNEVVELDFDGESANIVYKTDHLKLWWGNLDDEWQNIFRNALNFNKAPTREELHKLTGLKKFFVKSILIKDISVMEEFTRLRELTFNDTQISDISPLGKMKKLEVLDCSRNPIEDLSPLSQHTNLRIFYAENTRIGDIDALSALIEMEEVKIANTEVKDLKSLEGMSKLRVLDFSNTRVKNIKSIMELPNLQSLKCFNNGINSKKIDEFKASHPNCEVVFY